MKTRREFLVGAAMAAGAGGERGGEGTAVERIDIVHHTHTDIGYTDLPSVVRDKQVRYLRAAMALCGTQKGFRWTVESLVGLDDWWQAASPAERNRFLALVRAGRMDVMGLPFNQTPLLDARQWDQMMDWIPASLWRQVQPRAAMQNDVNGFPRAGATRLLDRGIRHLLMGINADSGGPPFARPCAFWWKMPDGRRLFVWLGEHYGKAMEYLGFYGSSLPDQSAPDFLNASHALCRKQLERLAAQGYSHRRLLLTFTHPRGYDNGGPFARLAPFVERWNAAGLKPSLHLVTATEAALAMEKEVGAGIPELEGEWTDWWANGSASGPREIAASRVAKRQLAAALSPAWGALPAGEPAAVRAILRDLCLFDEHTWGAAASVSAPHSLDTLAQYNEKSELAYRPMGAAGWLLDRRTRAALASQPPGTYVANPAPLDFTGWVKLDRKNRVWVERLPAHSLRSLPKEPDAGASRPEVMTDSTGWPVRATWPGMARPLFDGSAGEFVRGGLLAPADRRTITRLHAEPVETVREDIRRRSVRYSQAQAGPARREETGRTVVFRQSLRHERLGRAERTLELWNGMARARLTLRIERLSSVEPEILYAGFTLPEGLPLPVFSCGGTPFTPYRDQLKGACRDYFGIDGWAHYATEGGHWLWQSVDAPLVAVGGPHMLERHERAPLAPNRLMAILFDNCWHTNFVADSHGEMEFRFDLMWSAKIERPAEQAETLAAEALALVSPAADTGETV
jgi:hypothetical protein